ncbi:MAG: hypothetical protein AAFV69_12200 [Pseudomonadota bacterium]
MPDTQLPEFATPVTPNLAAGMRADTPAFTIATLVTAPAQYAQMCTSFEDGGFTPDTCEYLVIDNTQAGQDQTCAYRGLNAALASARAPYVILCHQDVRLLVNNRQTLEARLRQLDANHPDWALAGNAGGAAPGELAIRISDPHRQSQSVGDFPHRVFALDENFIVVRRSAQIGFSRNLQGFHFYGADICLAAETMGWEAYVIDFHLQHLSPGNKDTSFDTAKAAFRKKWSRAFRPRFIQTTCALVRLAPSLTSLSASPLIENALEKVTRRMPWAKGWIKPAETSLARSPLKRNAA